MPAKKKLKGAAVSGSDAPPCSGSSDSPEDCCCRECGCTMDLVHDDDGDLICCDCLFEEETNEINQP